MLSSSNTLCAKVSICEKSWHLYEVSNAILTPCKSTLWGVQILVTHIHSLAWNGLHIHDGVKIFCRLKKKKFKMSLKFCKRHIFKQIYNFITFLLCYNLNCQKQLGNLWKFNITKIGNECCVEFVLFCTEF